MTKPRLIAVLLSIILFCSLTGCSRQADGPAILPDDDPVCRVFPRDTLAAMLPGGTYDYLIPSFTSWISYLELFVATNGRCTILQTDGPQGGVYVDASEDDHSMELVNTCHDPLPIDLVVPQVGEIIDTGSCVKTNKYPGGQAWALYWGERDGFDGPYITLIDAEIYPRDGRDPVADATTLVQLVLDYIDQSYAADPSAAQPPASTPGATWPSPSGTPT